MNNYAFIDSQNLHFAIRKLGWHIEYAKFRRYLHDKHSVQKAYLFMGYVPENKNLYQSLEKAGYVIIFRPTHRGNNGLIKGNCDAELVLHCMIEYENFDQAIIVSGDGDFHCLITHLHRHDKLHAVGVPDEHRYSSLLRPLREKIFFISRLKEKLQRPSIKK